MLSLWWLLILASAAIAAVLIWTRHLMRPGGWPPPQKLGPKEKTSMNRLMTAGCFIAVAVIVVAVFGLLLEISGWHPGKENGAILVLALISTFLTCWMSDNIPDGLRPALAVVCCICWVGLVIHAHLGHGLIWKTAAFGAAALGPAFLAFAFDLAHNTKHPETITESVSA
jgi:hypothetical protein